MTLHSKTLEIVGAEIHAVRAAFTDYAEKCRTLAPGSNPDGTAYGAHLDTITALLERLESAPLELESTSGPSRKD